MSSLPIRLSQASGVPYYRQVVDQMSELIRSGQLLPGAQLPSVRELSRQLLVSLITVRRSYADLEAAGLIVRRQGQGTFVAADVESRLPGPRAGRGARPARRRGLPRPPARPARERPGRAVRELLDEIEEQKKETSR